MAPNRTRWTPAALRQFEIAIRYIARNSIQNAEKVRKAINDKADKLVKHPHKYPPDKYKKDNDGSYRAFELHSYRVSYRVKSSEIVVLRIRHTSMEPKGY